MHITPELMRDIAGSVRRRALPETGEITKSTALRYLAPEIMKLRVLGFKLEEIKSLLEEEGLHVSLPLFKKTLRPSSLLEVESLEDDIHG